MSIVLIMEGATETALKAHIKQFLDRQAQRENKPKIRLIPRSEINLKPDKLRRRVALELKQPEVTAVVGLIDVFPKFESASVAKKYLIDAAGDNPRFYAHAAQFDVEAWLLPYWDFICKRVKVQQSSPGKNPELVNHQQPPAYRLTALYQRAKPPRKYVKTTEMFEILNGQDLLIAANLCPELKAFLNTLLALGGLTPLS